jgi:hypothetical protein
MKCKDVDQQYKEEDTMCFLWASFLNTEIYIEFNILENDIFCKHYVEEARVGILICNKVNFRSST